MSVLIERCRCSASGHSLRHRSEWSLMFRELVSSICPKKSPAHNVYSSSQRFFVVQKQQAYHTHPSSTSLMSKSAIISHRSSLLSLYQHPWMPSPLDFLRCYRTVQRDPSHFFKKDELGLVDKATGKANQLPSPPSLAVSILQSSRRSPTAGEKTTMPKQEAKELKKGTTDSLSDGIDPITINVPVTSEVPPINPRSTLLSRARKAPITLVTIFCFFFSASSSLILIL